MTEPGQHAFPTPEYCKWGMTKREYFAGLAMQGQIAHYGSANSEAVAKLAVKAADALIIELNNGVQL